jgi:hypothetical protein
LAEPATRVRERGLHRADRTSHQVRHLGHWQIEEVVEADREMLPRGERLEAAFDVDVGFDRIDRWFDGQRHVRMPPGGAVSLPGLVGGDGEQPVSRRAAARIELLPLSPGRAQRVLKHVLPARIGREPRGQVSHRGPVRRNPPDEVRLAGQRGTRRVTVNRWVGHVMHASI